MVQRITHGQLPSVPIIKRDPKDPNKKQRQGEGEGADQPSLSETQSPEKKEKESDYSTGTSASERVLDQASLENILHELNKADYYRENLLFFILRQEDNKTWIELTKIRPERGDQPSEFNEKERLGGLIQKLTIGQLFDLWQGFKGHKKIPPKGGLINVSC